MKNVLFRRGISAVCAGILCASSAPAWGKSAKEVFAEVARSVVVVLALDSSGETSAQGSGVVVGKNQVATNCHVIEDAEKIVIRQAADSSGGENYRMSAEILARDNERDLCLLFVDELSEPPAAPVATMGEAKELTVGEEVFAVGAPEGLELSMSRGIVSQLRGIQGKHGAPLVQTDAAISPGSSGGGLFNENGELVGITTFKWRGENLNFAIPIEWMQELKEKGQAELAAAKMRKKCAAHPNYECIIAAALSIISSIDSANYRFWGLSVISKAQAKAGDKQAASDTLSVALSAIQSIDRASTRVSAFRDIALAQAKLGDEAGARNSFAAALSAVKNIGNDLTDPRGAALHDISKSQAEAGYVDDAFATARNISNEALFGHRTRTLLAIAKVQADSGKEEDARETFSIALSEASGAFELIHIAEAHMKLWNDTAAALSIVDQNLDDSEEKFLAWAVIVETLANSGDIAAALSMSRKILSPGAKARALSAIAKAQAKSGQQEKARKTFESALLAAESAESAFARDGILRQIMKAQSEAGYALAALSIASTISDSRQRNMELRDIAAMQVKLGNLDGAFTTVLMINNAGYHASVLCDIASKYAKAGDIDRAFSIAQSINNAHFCFGTLRSVIASAQAESGDFHSAMKIALEIESGYILIRTLADIADHLAARERN